MTFQAIYTDSSSLPTPAPLMPAQHMFRHQLAQEPEMGRYLIRSTHALYRARRRQGRVASVSHPDPGKP